MTYAPIAMDTPVYAWCFSHGRMHIFAPTLPAWCTASWVNLGASSLSSAEDIKRAHFGEARFLHDLDQR